MRIQLWSYNYDPEPTGIAPLSGVWARAMAARGHEIEVVAAHPHYPTPQWGRRLTPYREERDGIRLIRLPLWVGRASAAERVRQELTFTAALSAAAPLLSRPDLILAVSPSFPALGTAMASARLRGIPWVLWLQDILPDGAIATEIVPEGRLIDAARRFERAAYRSASKIVVISDSFAANLAAKGVPRHKMVRIYNPATLPIQERPRPKEQIDESLVFTMGNLGHSQNLEAVVRAFQASRELEAAGARFVLAGEGVAGPAVRAAARSDRVELTGLIPSDALKRLLDTAAVALVSQRPVGSDFNVPSKLMNFMACGIPTVGAVRTDSEVARILSDSGAGWVVGAGSEGLPETLCRALGDADERRRRAEAALDFARRNFAPEGMTSAFEDVLVEVLGEWRSTTA